MHETYRQITLSSVSPSVYLSLRLFAHLSVCILFTSLSCRCLTKVVALKVSRMRFKKGSRRRGSGY